MSKKVEHTFKSGYVAIVGQPNVGKSTLLNSLLDFKVSAVTRKPQTTRHQIRGILNGKEYQIIFLDTPGLLQPKSKLQDAMLNAAYRSLNEADVVLFLVNAASTPDEQDVSFLQKLTKPNFSCVLLINKIDRIPKNQVLPLMEFYAGFQQVKSVIPISALKRDGLDVLKKEIVQSLPEGLPLYDKDQISDQPERFLAAELIREQIFQRYGEEIPYSTTVLIEEFKERPHQKDLIKAVVYVEKPSQKGILIGKKGEAMKNIGRLAREEIEETLGRKVFLELWVKVRDKWRQNENSLREFGY